MAPVVVTILAAILRVWNLGRPHALIFDETYYVKDAWSQWNLGYPSAWPENADELFVSGSTDVFLTDPSFVVHPPLGKWLIGAGMWLFGADSAWGWRFSAVVFGIATVLVVYLLARTLSGSTVFASVAGLLMAIDGLAIVMSRVSLLDIFLTFFVVVSFWFVALDHRWHGDRLRRRLRTVDPAPAWGPVNWNRPWLVAAGLAAGAATGVKWSGLYVLAAIGIYVVVTDALARRRAQVYYWPADAVRQGLVSFVYLVPTAVVVYVVSWLGWITTTGGWERLVAQNTPATGLWSAMPSWVQSLWIYHQSMYGFHVGLSAEHGYASPAWQWPLLIRPTSMYWEQQESVQAISSLANPVLWWAATAATVYLIYRCALAPNWRIALVLTGLAATYVPWLLYPDRTIFQFYTIAMLPFLVLALTYALQAIAGTPQDPPSRRIAGTRVVGVFLIVTVAVSAFWYPVWTAMPVPYEFWRLHNWLPTWI